MGVGILVAVAFRIYRLDTMPPGIFVDETNGALNALSILEGRPLSPFGLGWYEVPLLYAYYTAGLLKLAGIGFASLKAGSLLPAILTVIFIYTLGRYLFGAGTALIAVFLLALSRWHVTMSRWGWVEIMPPLFQILATILLLKAFSSRRATHFMGAGMILGLGMYTYLSSRLVVTVVVAYVLYRSIIERDFLRKQAAGLLLAAFGFLLVFAPLMTTYAKNPYGFLNRSREVSILRDVEETGSWSPLFENAKRHALMFHVRGDPNPRHNLPGLPMLSAVPAVLLLLGLGVALSRFRDHRMGLLLLWISITLLGGVLSRLGEGPQAFRTLAVVPALCLLAAVAASALGAVLVKAGWPRWVCFLLLSAALGQNAFATYRTYFGDQAESMAVWWGFNGIENGVARHLQTEREKSGKLDHVYLSPTFYYWSTVRFLLYREPGEDGGGLEAPDFHIIQPQIDLPLLVDGSGPSGVRSGPILLVLQRDLFAEGVALAAEYYPNLNSRKIEERGEVLFGEIVIPASDLEAVRGLSLLDRDGTVIEPVAAVDRLQIDRLLASLQTGQALAGAFSAPRSGAYGFRVLGPIELELDGRIVADELVLGRGLHNLSIRRLSGQDRPAIEYRQPSGSWIALESDRLFRLTAPTQGLRGRYYSNRNWEGEPAFERIDPILASSWPGEEPLPGSFSVRWEGLLQIVEGGTHSFELHCDDGCSLILGGALLASRLQDGVHMLQGQADLQPGKHELRIDYYQAGGGKGIQFKWLRPGGRLELVGPRFLTPVPASGR